MNTGVMGSMDIQLPWQAERGEECRDAAWESIGPMCKFGTSLILSAIHSLTMFLFISSAEYGVVLVFSAASVPVPTWPQQR